mmetsp:Transcript_32119/g.95847  ORF Transcript_32119/g.95847 Transcript_32119/m.95847 type:complete len:314 (+) Transcript_32119:87-1028(+)
MVDALYGQNYNFDIWSHAFSNEKDIRLSIDEHGNATLVASTSGEKGKPEEFRGMVKWDTFELTGVGGSDMKEKKVVINGIKLAEQDLVDIQYRREGSKSMNTVTASKWELLPKGESGENKKWTRHPSGHKTGASAHAQARKMQDLSIADPEISMETAGRFTAEEFESTCKYETNKLSRSEELVCHFTTLESAKFILASGSHGLRASKVGQAGGGLSICVEMPHQLGWDKHRGGEFLATVGKKLWGDKADDAPAGVQVCLLLKIRKSMMDAAKTVPGRPAIRIIELEDLGDQKPDKNYYLSKERIVKAYNLMQA